MPLRAPALAVPIASLPLCGRGERHRTPAAARISTGGSTRATALADWRRFQCLYCSARTLSHSVSAATPALLCDRSPSEWRLWPPLPALPLPPLCRAAQVRRPTDEKTGGGQAWMGTHVAHARVLCAGVLFRDADDRAAPPEVRPSREEEETKLKIAPTRTAAVRGWCRHTGRSCRAHIYLAC